jgi:hypothetical protein
VKSIKHLKEGVGGNLEASELGLPLSLVISPVLFRLLTRLYPHTTSSWQGVRMAQFSQQVVAGRQYLETYLGRL